MEYIDTLKPLNDCFLAEEYPTPEAYEKATGEKAPEFNVFKPIKLWKVEPPTSAVRQMSFTVFAKDDGTQVRIFNEQGFAELDTLVLSRVEASTVNIPPQNFNFTQWPLLKKYGQPLKLSATVENDFVRAPDGFSVVVRDKKLYAQYLKEKQNPGANSDFQKEVLEKLDKILSLLAV